MVNDYFNKVREWLASLGKKGTKPGAEEMQVHFAKNERIFVFIASYIIALSMWFLVNLNGIFNITIKMPVEIGAIPSTKALTDDLPKFVEVNLTGTALPLISLYNNPPTVTIAVDAPNVNVFNQVRQRMNSVQEVEVIKVEPLVIQVNLEDKITKKVPIHLPNKLSFESRFGLIGEPKLVPDSIEISGAASQINNIQKWVIKDTLELANIRDDVNKIVLVNNENPLIETSLKTLIYQANVSEFTESEISVLIKTRDLPRGESITYNPASIVIKYDVPLKQYAELSRLRPYEVYVSYSKIKEDRTGFVTPDIELVAPQYNLKLRSFQPKAVAYFSVLDM